LLDRIQPRHSQVPAFGRAPALPSNRLRPAPVEVQTERSGGVVLVAKIAARQRGLDDRVVDRTSDAPARADAAGQSRRAELGRTEQAIERAEIRRLEGIDQWLGRRGQESPASARGEPGLLEPDRQGIHDRDASADRRRSKGGIEYKAGDRRVRSVEYE